MNDIEDALKDLESRLRSYSGVPGDEFNWAKVNSINPGYIGKYEKLGFPECFDTELLKSQGRNKELVDSFEEFLESWIASKTIAPSPWSRVTFEEIRPMLSVFADWLAGKYKDEEDI